MIQPGTKVLRDDNTLVELIGLVIVDAIRQEDGGFIYKTTDHRYYCSAGCCRFYALPS